MTLSEARRYFRIWHKWYWPCHCILEATFGTKIPESYLPVKKEILEEALNVVAKYYFDIGDKKASTDIQNMIVYIWLYSKDEEVLNDKAKSWSNPKAQECSLIFINSFKNSWSKMIEDQLNTSYPDKPYLIGGKQELINHGKPYYGTKDRMLSNTNGEWETILFIAEPSFIEKPTEVDEETFTQKMLELGASKDDIESFINYEDNWDNS